MPRTPKPWKRPDRKGWWCCLNGRVRKIGDTKQEAETKLASLLREQGRAEPSTLRADELCAEFIKLGTTRLAPLTQEWYDRHLDSFVLECGTITVEAIRPLDVTKWLAKHEWSPTTQRGAVTAVKRAFRWAKQQGLIDVNPLEDLQKPAAERRAATLKPGQGAEVIGSYKADDPWRVLLEALRETGCRPGELSGLTAEGVDLITGTWTVANKTRRATREPTRVVYLTAAMLEASKRLVAQWPSGPIFRNARGRPWTRNAMACRFARLRTKKDMGPEATAYAYRHDYVTDALESGVPIATVAELVGHKDVTMIQRVYSRLSERRDHLKKAAEQVRPHETNDDPS